MHKTFNNKNIWIECQLLLSKYNLYPYIYMSWIVYYITLYKYWIQPN